MGLLPAEFLKFETEILKLHNLRFIGRSKGPGGELKNG